MKCNKNISKGRKDLSFAVHRIIIHRDREFSKAKKKKLKTKNDEKKIKIKNDEENYKVHISTVKKANAKKTIKVNVITMCVNNKS